MTTKRGYEVARERLADLQAEVAEHEAQAAAHEQRRVELESQRGATLLAGGSLAELGEQIGQEVALREAEQQAVAILRGRVAEAEGSQRRTVAQELRDRATALEKDVGKREGELAKVAAQWERLDGPRSCVRNPAFSRCLQDGQRVQRLRSAADMIERGLDCPLDQATGLAFDSDLW